MNLLDAQVAGDDGRIVVSAEGLGGDLWDGDTVPLDVVLGLRPEHLQIVDATTAHEGVRVAVTVDIVENLGGEQILTCSTGAGRLQERTSRDVRVSDGDRLTLHVSPEHVHLFDRSTGRRLEWVPDAARTADGIRADDRVLVP
jgi:multiple sugar transport system ATP-binding protein